MLHNTVKIANGESESGVIDLHGQVIVGLLFPSAWTAADITLLASVDNATFVPVYDAAGNETTIQADTSRFVALDPATTRAFRYVKLRSGTAAAPVNQGAERTVMVAVEPSGGA